MSKNPVVRFYELMGQFLAKDKRDIELTRSCRDILLRHSKKISMFDDGRGNVFEQMDDLFERKSSTVVRLALAEAAFRDLAPWFTSDVKAQEAFTNLVIDEHRDDLFVSVVKIKRKNAFVNGNVVASSATMLQGLLDVGDTFSGQTPKFVRNGHMIGPRFA